SVRLFFILLYTEVWPLGYLAWRTILSTGQRRRDGAFARRLIASVVLIRSCNGSIRTDIFESPFCEASHRSATTWRVIANMEVARIPIRANRFWGQGLMKTSLATSAIAALACLAA